MPRCDISDRFAAQAARTRQTRKQRSLVRLDQRDSQPDDGLETALPFWKEPAAEIEDTLSLHISIIATNPFQRA